jgi:HD superfamily phosphohydrolase
MADDKANDLVAIVRGLLHVSNRKDHAQDDLEKIVLLKKRRIPSRLCPITLDLPQHPNVTITKDHVIIIGGGGVVIKCEHAEVPNARFALKVTRPSLFNDFLAFNDEIGKAQLEFKKGLSLSHQNVVKALVASAVQVAKDGPKPHLPVPVILAEWVEGAKNLREYLLHKKPNSSDLVHMLIELLSGLHHLHESGLIHWDIKSDNILVSELGQVKITDLGNSRYTSGRSHAQPNGEVAQTSYWNLPAILTAKLPPPSSGFSINRVNVSSIGPELDTPWLDLWMLAKELNRFFLAEAGELEKDLAVQAEFKTRKIDKQIFDRAETEAFLAVAFPANDEEAQFRLSAIRVILQRLLSPSTPKDAYYATAKSVCDDLEKLLPEFGAAQLVTELRSVPQHNIRIPTATRGNDAFPRRFRALVDTAALARLKKHQQLATVHDVFPGARHTRFEHSIGVFQATIEYVRALYADRRSPFWRLSAEAEDIEALLIASLFHDVGHYSFSHYVEDLRGIFSEYKHENYAAAVFDERRAENLAEEFRKAAGRDREEITRVLKNVWGLPDEKIKTLGEKVASIIRPSYGAKDGDFDPIVTRKGNRYAVTMIMHSVLDSVMDADKLDYLVRDGHHTGVKYCDGIDDRRFFQSLTTVVRKDDVKKFEEIEAMFLAPTICVTTKGILPMLSILSARLFIFSCVYWHKTVRAETSMLQHIIACLIAAQPNERAAEAALQQFVVHALSHSERQTLEYLEKAVVDAKCDPRVRQMCLGLLGERPHVFRSTYELNYNPSADPKNIFNAIDGQIQKIQKNEKARSAARAVMRFKQKIARSVMQNLASEAKVSLDEHDLLVDVPPQGKDQIKNAFVATGQGVLPIQAVSPLANAIDESFRLWVRTLRVYMSRDAIARCEAAGISPGKIRKACRDSLDPQGRLPI